MKNIIITLTLLSLSLHASVEQVQTYYDAGQYAKALQEAKNSTEEYWDADLHLLWAKSAEKLGLDNEAMSAYERVEMLDENNLEARVALVKLYKRTGRDNLARAGAKELQNYQLTPEQRSSLDALRGVNVHSFKASASLATGYDTNINVASNDLTGTASEALATMFAQFAGSVSYINEIQEKGAWYLRGDLQIYDQTNFASGADLYDMLVGAGGVGFGYAGNGYDFYMPLAYDTINYLNTNLLSQIKLQPRLNYTLSNELLLSTDLSYISRSYTSDDGLDNRDDSSVGAGMGLYYLLGQDYVYAKVKYEDYSAKNAVTQYVNRSVFSTSLGVNYNLSSWLVLKGDYRFRLGSYKEDRSDFFNQVEVKFSHYFGDMYEAFISDSYAKNSSDLSEFAYSKNIFMFGIALNY